MRTASVAGTSVTGTARAVVPWRRAVPAVAALLVIALTVSLGRWQLRRADEKRAWQASMDSAAAAAPRRLTGAPVAAADLDGRRVEATGRFDDARAVFLDNRTYKGRAGFHVLSPLRLDDGMHVLVLRGWVPRDPVERTRLPALAPGGDGGTVRVEGIAAAALQDAMSLDATRPGEGPGGRIWQRVRIEDHARWSGLRLQPVIIRQTNDTGDGLVRDWPRQEAGVDKHLGYAFQWFAMAAATALLWLWHGFFRKRDGRQQQARR